MWSAANVAIHNLTSLSLRSHLLMMKSWSTTTIALRKHWRPYRASKAPPARSVGSPQAKSMSTIRVLNNVPVHLPEGLSEKQLLSFRPFQVSPPFSNPPHGKLYEEQSLTLWQQWTTTLDKSLTRQSAPGHPFHKDPYSLRSITVQSFDLWGHERIGFMKVLASVCNSAGEALPASAFLRGPSVAMLVMLIPDDAAPDSDERYVVLTVQPRVPAGSLSFVELPAGMVDDAGSFKGAAAKEIEEELGITIHEDELVSLNDLAAEAAGHRDDNDDDEGLPTAMFPSAGGCDEHITIFSCERRIPRSQLSEWNGRLTGLRSEGEKITLKLVPMKNLWMEGARDAKCLGALALWEALRREKKLKHTRQEQEN